MIKIAFVINTIHAPTGGTENQLLLLLKHLDRSRFHPVLCVVHMSEWLEQGFDLCPLYDLGIRSYKEPAFLLRFWRFVRYLKAERIDILHTLFTDGMRIGIVAGKLAGIRSIIAVRRNQGYWMMPSDLTITRLLNRWVSLLIANSHSTRQWVVDNEQFPADRIHVIHNGIDLDAFQRTPADTRGSCRSGMAIPSSAPVIGIVANLRPVKDINTFIRAAQLVKTTLPEAHFVVVGEGEEEHGLKRLAAELGILGSTHFLGRRQDIPAILSALDVGVLSSSSESFSTSLVEYLAVGLPVVCTDVGGAREVVTDAVNGYVVAVGNYREMADRVMEILRGDAARDMGAANRQKARAMFALDAMVQQYEGVYSRLDAGNGRTS